MNTVRMQGRRRAWRSRCVRPVLLVLLAAFALCACTAPRLSYQRLDWLASWKAGEYVDFDVVQQRQFDAAFKALWTWHRADELPRYGQDLQELAAASQGPVSAGALQAWAGRAEAHSNRLLERALPAACTLIAGFSADQRDSVLRRVDRKLADDADKYLAPPEAELRKQANKRLRRSLERWVGKLSPVQTGQVRAWSQTRPLRYEAWIAERRHWREQFSHALNVRPTPALCAALKSLFPLPVSERPAGARAWFEFLAGFSAGLSEDQRRHLREELLELATDASHLHAL